MLNLKSSEAVALESQTIKHMIEQDDREQTQDDSNKLQALTIKLFNYGRFKHIMNQLGFSDSSRLKWAKRIVSLAYEFHGGKLPFPDDILEPKGDRMFGFITINGFNILEASTDTTSSINVMSLSTFKAACIPEKSLVSFSAGWGPINTRGLVTVDLQVGPYKSTTCFHVIETNENFRIIMGRSWSEEYEKFLSSIQ